MASILLQWPLSVFATPTAVVGIVLSELYKKNFGSIETLKNTVTQNKVKRNNIKLLLILRLLWTTEKWQYLTDYNFIWKWLNSTTILNCFTRSRNYILSQLFIYKLSKKYFHYHYIYLHGHCKILCILHDGPMFVLLLALCLCEI